MQSNPCLLPGSHVAAAELPFSICNWISPIPDRISGARDFGAFIQLDGVARHVEDMGTLSLSISGTDVV